MEPESESSFSNKDFSSDGLYAATGTDGGTTYVGGEMTWGAGVDEVFGVTTRCGRPRAARTDCT
jgi:hypothetical protein